MAFVLGGGGVRGAVEVGHTGLEELVTLKSLWNALPMDKNLVMNAWYVPPSDIPKDRAERTQMLFDWWETIDQWIEDTEVDPQRFRP